MDASRAGPDPRQPASTGKVVSRKGMRPSATKGRRASPPRSSQEDFSCLTIKTVTSNRRALRLSPDGGKVSIEPPQVPTRIFQPVVIKGGLTPRSEVSDYDRAWERLIRLGVRPGG